MQRLFPAFPQGWPGVGLLLLRLLLAGGLFVDAVTRLHSPAAVQIAMALGGILTGSLLAVGLWTPIAGCVVCLFQLAVVFTSVGALEPSLQRATVALCLAFLGPGGWSIDARLFGRRRIRIRSIHHN